MKAKRILCAAMVLCLLLSLLCSCGKEEGSPESVLEGTLEMPVFSFNSSCVLTIENLDPQLHYEIRSNGNSLGIYMAQDMENYCLPWGESISIRSLDPATGATSPWTPEQMTHPTESMGSAGAPPAQGSQDPSLPQLPAPKLSIGATGLISVEADENAAFIRLVDTATGEDVSYWEDFENRAKPGSVLVAYALGDGVRYRDSEASEAVAFDAETVTFSLTENPLSSATENPDGSMTLIAYSNRGNAYEFRIEGEVTQTPEGWGLLASGSAIYNVDAMHGIFATICPENAVSAHMLSWGSGYMLDSSDRVDSIDRMDNWACGFVISTGYNAVLGIPSYFAIGDKPSLMVGNSEPTGETFLLESITLCFDGIETQIEGFIPHPYFHRATFLPGTPYISEGVDYNMQMNCSHADLPVFAVDYFPTADPRVGDLKDAQGNVIPDPQSHYMQPGDTLELFLGDNRIDLPLVAEPVGDAMTANEARPFTFSDTTGEMDVIVVPIVWNDQPERANDQNRDAILRAFGNVLDESGNVTVYAPEDPAELSLSEYYRIASYNQLTLNAFVTDWYSFDLSSAELEGREWGREYDDIYAWILQTYPGLDLSRFDNDADGILDEIVFINTADPGTVGFTGSYRYVNTFGGRETSGGGTPEQPGIYHFVNLTLGHLLFEDRVETGILIHEFGHTIALNDYYDIGEGMRSFLGGYDMQDGSMGDWNVYSKFCAGWLKPTIVEESSFGTESSLTFTLRSSALYGDALVIPAAGYAYNGTPYDEYLMVDLYTPEGLHAGDSALYELDSSVGVRIYHVSDLLELGTSVLEGGKEHRYGIQHYENNSSTLYSQKHDIHQLEIISATGKDDFSLRNYRTEDLFAAGDRFSAERFTDFFPKGKMDNGMVFGYEITVDSIEQVDGEYVATVTVTRK